MSESDGTSLFSFINRDGTWSAVKSGDFFDITGETNDVRRNMVKTTVIIDESTASSDTTDADLSRFCDFYGEKMYQKSKLKRHSELRRKQPVRSDVGYAQTRQNRPNSKPRPCQQSRQNRDDLGNQVRAGTSRNPNNRVDMDNQVRVGQRQSRQRRRHTRFDARSVGRSTSRGCKWRKSVDRSQSMLVNKSKQRRMSGQYQCHDNAHELSSISSDDLSSILSDDDMGQNNGKRGEGKQRKKHFKQRYSANDDKVNNRNAAPQDERDNVADRDNGDTGNNTGTGNDTGNGKGTNVRMKTNAAGDSEVSE